jgi:hypothetical protein
MYGIIATRPYIVFVLSEVSFNFQNITIWSNLEEKLSLYGYCCGLTGFQSMAVMRGTVSSI